MRVVGGYGRAGARSEHRSCYLPAHTELGAAYPTRGQPSGHHYSATYLIRLMADTTSTSARCTHSRTGGFQQPVGDLRGRAVPMGRLVDQVLPPAEVGGTSEPLGMIDVMVKMSKLAVVRMMVLCMMMQTSRAMPTEPLALDGSLELYALLAVAGMALVGMWEAFWYVWDRCCSGHEDHRPSRRHRRLQETVQREIAARLAALDAAEPTTPLAETASRPQTSTAASSSSAVGRGRAALTRKRTLDVGIQTDPMPAHSGPVEVREVIVPQWHEGPVYVSAHGDHFHTVCSCWGLRNVHKPRKLMFCNLCQNHSGRSIY